MKRLSKNLKSKLLLYLVLTEVIIVCFTLPSVAALKNKNIDEVDNEIDFKGYAFSDSYGSHDWVADCALRVIAQDETYKSYISWLYDSNDLVMYNKLDYVDQWYESERAYYGGLLFRTSEIWMNTRRYVTFLHGTSAPDFSISFKNVNLPEKIQKEEVRLYKPFWSKSSGPLRFHSQFFVRTDKFFSSSHPWTDSCYVIDPNTYGTDTRFQWDEKWSKKGWAPEFTMMAAFDALRWLSKKDKNNVIGRDAKYEAAAFCLGGMTHFIADVSTPTHVTPDDNISPTQINDNIHKTYESYVASKTNWLNLEWKGGPDLTQIDPFKFISDKELVLQPMIPFQACMDQAEYTELGADYIGEGYSLRNLESGDFTPIDPTGVNDWSNMQWVGKEWWLTHPYCSWGMGNNKPSSSNAYGIRQNELINWAVYHCACAILWVCEAAGMNSRDSYSDRDQPPSNIYAYTTAMSYQQIKSWRKGELDGRTVSGWEKWLGLDQGSLANITGLAMILAPALAVASTVIVIPIFLTKKVKAPA